MTATCPPESFACRLEVAQLVCHVAESSHCLVLVIRLILIEKAGMAASLTLPPSPCACGFFTKPREQTRF